MLPFVIRKLHPLLAFMFGGFLDKLCGCRVNRVVNTSMNGAGANAVALGAVRGVSVRLEGRKQAQAAVGGVAHNDGLLRSNGLLNIYFYIFLAYYLLCFFI